MKSLAFLFLCLSLSTSSVASADQSVVGGSTVPPGRWPDVVAVIMRGGACSGTLIAPDVVLTAGHCIDAGPTEVIIDTVDYGRAGGERIPVAWSRAYPDWWRRYDIGVLMLERPARQQPRVVAAACTAREHLVSGKLVELVGFGLATYAATDMNTKLHQASVAITDPTCTLDPSCEPSVAPHGEFMAGGRGADSCFGDSGGPVYAETEDGHVLIGVVSRGLAVAATPCGGGGVYVRVDKVTSWIQSVTGRKLERTSCGGRADDGGEVDGGGCSTGRTSGGAVLLVIGAIMLRRRRRS